LAVTSASCNVKRRRFTFILASARRSGNTERLASRAAEALPAEWDQCWLRLADLPLPPFVDRRHPAVAYPEPRGVERLLLDETLAATDLVLVVPLYWYSLPASAKTYLDYWSGWLRAPGADFRRRMAGKTLWGVCVLSDEDPGRADPLIGALEITANYMAMNFGGVLLGYGNRPGDVLVDSAALERAEVFFRHSPRPAS
jgi:hypothetical protein